MRPSVCASKEKYTNPCCGSAERSTGALSSSEKAKAAISSSPPSCAQKKRTKKRPSPCSTSVKPPMPHRWAYFSCENKLKYVSKAAVSPARNESPPPMQGAALPRQYSSRVPAGPPPNCSSYNTISFPFVFPPRGAALVCFAAERASVCALRFAERGARFTRFALRSAPSASVCRLYCGSPLSGGASAYSR